jgi:hypothetical protein
MNDFNAKTETENWGQEAASQAPSAARATTITVLTSIKPKTTGKAYTLEPDGTLSKKAVVAITDATAEMIEVPTAEAMLAVIEQVTQSTNQVLVLNGFKNWSIGLPFNIVTNDRLEQLLGKPVGDRGVYEVDCLPFAARLKRSVTPSVWLLLDADNPVGIPPEWAALSRGDRLKLLERVLPGISTCERVQYASSTPRVRKKGSETGPLFLTHALVRVTHPERIDTLREYLRVMTVVESLSFETPRYSKSEPGKVIGHEHRTLFDLAPICMGRIVFPTRPDVSKAPGYMVIPAGARIVNSGGGALDIGAIALPDAAALTGYKDKTGLSVSFSSTRGTLSVVVTNALKMETEIESRGVVKPLSEWLAGMTEGEKLRCETPFRASQSEAAFIKKKGDADAILYDSGTNTTYPLTATFPDVKPDDLASAPERDPIITKMNERYVVVENINAIFDVAPGKLGNGEWKMPMIVTSAGMELRFKNKIARVIGRSVVNWYQHWLGHPNRAEFADIGCYPPNALPAQHYNMFRGPAVPSVKGSWKKTERFLREIICAKDPNAYDYLLNLLCWWVQNPCVRPRVSILLMGPQGLGKGVFVRNFLAGLMGERHLLHLTKPSQLTADHNEAWAWTLLRFFDEIAFGKNLAISGFVKALDTEEDLWINPKYVKAYPTPNIALNIYATNEASGGVPLDRDDRRKFVLRVAASEKENHAYFEDLIRAFQGGELSAFLHDALNRDLKSFNRLKVYSTLARAEVADVTATLEAEFLLQTLEQGVLPGGQWTPKPAVNGRGGWVPAKGNAWPVGAVTVPTDALFAMYLEFARQRAKRPGAKAQLSSEFKNQLGDAFDQSSRMRVPGSDHAKESRYWFASLGDCRAAFDAFCKRPREWPETPSAQILPFPQSFPGSGEDGEEAV